MGSRRGRGNQVDKYTRGQLEVAADRGFLSAWELSWVAASGASYLIVLIMLFPLVIVNAVRARIRDAIKGAALDDQIAHVAEQLGVHPPPRTAQRYAGLARAIVFFTLMAGVGALLVVIGLAIGRLRLLRENDRSQQSPIEHLRSHRWV